MNNIYTKSVNYLLTAFIMLIGVFWGTSVGQTSKNWIARGNHPQDYDMGGDPAASHSSNDVGYIQSKESQSEGFGTWMTSIKPDGYINQRIRLSAFIKTEDVKDWCKSSKTLGPNSV